MATYDFKCPTCGIVEERSHYLWDGVHPIERCKHDDAIMERLPAAPSFVVNGYSAKNGYSKGNK